MSEVTIPAPVAAIKVGEILWKDDKCVSAGGFCFRSPLTDPIIHVLYVCPCGCGMVGGLNFIRLGTPIPSTHKGPTWVWDGNEEKPTISPSVLHIGHWHGWLKNGMWTQA